MGGRQRMVEAVTVTMTAPSTARQDWLRDLHARIVATKAALDGARAAYEHSPNVDTERAMSKVGRELNRLLDLLPRPRSEQ